MNCIIIKGVCFMTKKINKIIAILIIIVAIIVFACIYIFNKAPVDENKLYSKQFNKTFLKFERYDYVLGQNMIVGVEKSTDKEKTYTKVTKESIVVSNEAKFMFLTERLAFIISTNNLQKNNNYKGFKVTTDGGKTFYDAQINYENDDIDILTIEDFPYYEKNTLKLKCSIYTINKSKDGYENIELLFESKNNGLSWNLSK